MNYFLLLKNELSLNFLRQTDNIVQTVRLAAKLQAMQTSQPDSVVEPAELVVLEKLNRGLNFDSETSENEEE
jgi:hypothetical protein